MFAKTRQNFENKQATSNRFCANMQPKKFAPDETPTPINAMIAKQLSHKVNCDNA